VETSSDDRDVRADVPSVAHHGPNGGFQNPWPDSGAHGFKDFLRWRIQRRGNVVPDPPFGSLTTRSPEIVAPRGPRDHSSVTWVGHSTLLVQVGSVNLLTDPVWSERASPFQWIGPRRLMPPAVDFDALPEIDVVLQSHDHYDHLDAGMVRRLVARFPKATWLCPLGVDKRLRAFGVKSVVARDWWQSVETPGFTATCKPARHFSGRTIRDRNSTLWCGWTITVDGFRIFFAGDSALHPAFSEIASRLGPFDLIAMPIGAYDPRDFMRSVHMNPEEGLEAYRAASGGSSRTPVCVPIHWGTFRLTDEPVDEPPRRFAAAWRAAGLPPELNWTLAHGETRRV
jgi:N-acyl-phosphatidylethanolamine-hydrolysing phospholipase D